MIKIIFRIILLIAVIVGLVYGYLFYMKQSALRQNEGVNSAYSQLEMLADKEGGVTLEGKVVIIDNSYFLELDEGTQIELKTTQLSLGSYLNKRVELSGKLNKQKVEISKIQEI